MKISNQKIYNKWVKNNTDPYGKAVVDYAIRWAEMMEAETDAGKRILDIAKQTSRDADTEGITGFMYGCAVQMLSSCWVHGETLRQWHNIETQFGNEGEEANKSGGVLNPALLNFSSKAVEK